MDKTPLIGLLKNLVGDFLETEKQSTEIDGVIGVNQSHQFKCRGCIVNINIEREEEDHEFDDEEEDDDS